MGKQERKQYFSNMIKSIEELEKENSKLKSLNENLKSQLEVMYLKHHEEKSSFVERDTYAENRIKELEQELKNAERNHSKTISLFNKNVLDSQKIIEAEIKAKNELSSIKSKWYYKLFA